MLNPNRSLEGPCSSSSGYCYYATGVGGACAGLGFEPPAGYWCACAWAPDTKGTPALQSSGSREQCAHGRQAGRRAGRWHTSWHIPWMLASTVRRRLAHTQFLAGAWRQKPRAGQPGRWGQRGEGGAQQHGLAQARARCRVARCAGARRTHHVAPRTPPSSPPGTAPAMPRCVVYRYCLECAHSPRARAQRGLLRPVCVWSVRACVPVRFRGLCAPLAAAPPTRGFTRGLGFR